MKVVGITGRSGCGKSSATNFLREKGYPCIDADLVAREVLLPGSPCIAQLQQVFGADIADENGTVRRRLLADRAFATPEGTAALTDITQPEILRRIDAALDEARRGGADLAFVDGAVIVGTPFEARCDALILVTAPYETSVARICARDGIAPEMARRRAGQRQHAGCPARKAAIRFEWIGEGGNMPKAKKRKRSILAPILALLLVLALAGTLLFSTFRDKIEHWEYPQRFTEYVEYYAGKYGIDPMILYAFIRTESNFDPNADSDAGARGLMQITEVTFDWIKMKIAPKESLTFDDLYDPETNIRFGSYFVSYCLDRYSGHLATAAAAYHSGVGTVDGLLGQEAYSTDGVTLDHYPYPQMRLYVKKITESYQHYSEIYK